MTDFRNLKVWQKAHALALDTGTVATKIRGNRFSALRNQMTRAAESIPTNIVEGRAQRTDREFARFLRISIASSSELEYHILHARDKGLMSNPDYADLSERVVEVRRMLYGLIDRLNGKKSDDGQ